MKKKPFRIISACVLATAGLTLLTGCGSDDVLICGNRWYGEKGGPLEGKLGTYESHTTADAAKPYKDGKKETIYKASSTDGDEYYLWKSTVNGRWYCSTSY